MLMTPDTVIHAIAPDRVLVQRDQVMLRWLLARFCQRGVSVIRPLLQPPVWPQSGRKNISFQLFDMDVLVVLRAQLVESSILKSRTCAVAFFM